MIAGFCKKCQVSFSWTLQHTSALSDLALPSAGLKIKSSSLSRGLARTLECGGARSSVMGLDWPQVCFAACLMVMPACKSVCFLIFFHSCHSFLDYASLIDWINVLATPAKRSARKVGLKMGDWFWYVFILRKLFGRFQPTFTSSLVKWYRPWGEPGGCDGISLYSSSFSALWTTTWGHHWRDC